MSQTTKPVQRFWQLLQEEKGDITAIYFFAILSGGIQLSLPVGIQAIIGYVLGGVLSASLVVLISILVVAVVLTGVLQLSQMRLIEKIQQRIFTRYAYAFADRIPRLDLKTTLRGFNQRHGYKIMVVFSHMFGFYFLLQRLQGLAYIPFGYMFGNNYRFMNFKIIAQQVHNRHFQDLRQRFYMVHGKLRNVVFYFAVRILRNVHFGSHILLRKIPKLAVPFYNVSRH